MYNVLYFTILIAIIEARLKIFLTDTPIVLMGQRIYKKELLTDKFQDAKELAYDSSSRNLFFMYMDDVIQNSGRGYVNIVTKNDGKIHGIERNKATAVDEETSDVYFGSDDGLYKYDPLTNEAANIGLYNVNILKLVIRNNEMYIIDANNHMIYKIFNEGQRAVKVGNWQTVMLFDVDNNKNIHFVTICGLYCAINGHETVKNSDLSAVYHFIVDEDKTYGVTEDGIYNINCVNGTANKVLNLNFLPSSIIFGDYGDIFYSVYNKIYRLRPVNSYHVYNIYRNNTV